MAVDRCVCHNVPFTEALRLQREEGLSLQEIVRRTGASTGCTMCALYLQVALATGETDLPVLSPDEVRERLRRAERAPGEPRR